MSLHIDTARHPQNPLYLDFDNHCRNLLPFWFSFLYLQRLGSCAFSKTHGSVWSPAPLLSALGFFTVPHRCASRRQCASWNFNMESRVAASLVSFRSLWGLGKYLWGLDQAGEESHTFSDTQLLVIPSCTFSNFNSLAICSDLYSLTSLSFMYSPFLL